MNQIVACWNVILSATECGTFQTLLGLGWLASLAIKENGKP